MGCSNQPLWHCNTPPLIPGRESAHNTKRSERGESAESIGPQRLESRGDKAKVAGARCLYLQMSIWQKKKKQKRRRKNVLMEQSEAYTDSQKLFFLCDWISGAIKLGWMKKSSIFGLTLFKQRVEAAVGWSMGQACVCCVLGTETRSLWPY